MKRKTYVILLLIGFLLASCSPETVKQMPKEEIEESSTMAVATASGSSLEIRFKPVAFAKAYAYSIGDDEIREGITPGYENGYYTFKADIPEKEEESATMSATFTIDVTPPPSIIAESSSVDDLNPKKSIEGISAISIFCRKMHMNSADIMLTAIVFFVPSRSIERISMRSAGMSVGRFISKFS